MRFRPAVGLTALLFAAPPSAAIPNGYYVKDTSEGYQFYDIAAQKRSGIVVDGNFGAADGWD